MGLNLKIRKPDFYVGGEENPYMKRWWLTDRIENKFKTYLHIFLRDDEDRALHDHPSNSVSFILWGGYKEHTPNGIKRRYPGMIIYRKATAAHRIELYRYRGKIVKACTIFVFGPKLREWGFHCPKGWVHWMKFTKPGAPGEIGAGCGEE